MGMMAENMQRQALGESMAYCEEDFLKLLEKKYAREEMEEIWKPKSGKGLTELNNIE